ncbi:MAG: HD domain-containing protein [Acidobacteria bacterium]|nr:HD domain-containing protein [Acidobacteriota bacterium]
MSHETSSRLAEQLRFVHEVDRLKSVLRRTRITDGTRHENSAEHSWHLALMVLVLEEHGPPGLDLLRVLRMVLVHDVVEIDAGDTFAYDAQGKGDQAERERLAAERLFGLLPGDQASFLRQAWDEFEARETPEARFAHAVDRLQPLLLNLANEGYSWRQHGVRHHQVLERMAPIAEASQALDAEMRRLLEYALEMGWLEA